MGVAHDVARVVPDVEDACRGAFRYVCARGGSEGGKAGGGQCKRAKRAVQRGASNFSPWCRAPTRECLSLSDDVPFVMVR